MNRIYIFVGTHLPSIAAAMLVIGLLVAGSILGVQSDPVWLNRFGALIVVVGILLGTSRYYEGHIQGLMAQLHGDRALFIRDSIENVEERLGRSVTLDERIQVAIEAGGILADGKTVEAIAQRLVMPHVGRIKVWEILIVLLGTIVNGFGDLAVNWVLARVA